MDRNAELWAAITSRRVSVLLPILVMLSAVAFMALFELGKDLLFPSISLWRSHLITIMVGGAIATVASLFFYFNFRSFPQSYPNISRPSPVTLFVHLTH